MGTPVEESRDHRRCTGRRSSSRGAAIGTAVHRVLELVNLATPEPNEVRRLADLACAELVFARPGGAASGKDTLF